MGDEQTFWAGIRQLLLGFVDLIERVKLNYPDEKRTASLRKKLKKARYQTR